MKRTRQYVYLGMICCWVHLQCNYPTEEPAQSNIPDSFKNGLILNAFSQADSLTSHSEFSEALQAYQAIEDRLTSQTDVPEDDLSWLRLKMARIMMQKDRPADAEALLDTIIRRTPESLWATEARIEKGRSIQSAHQYIKALNYYIEAFNFDPQQFDGYLAFRIALCYQESQQFEKAITWYGLAKKRLPVLADYTLYFSAQCLKALDRTQDAFEYLKELKDHYPHSPFQNTISPEIYDSYLDTKIFTTVIDEIRQSLRNSHWIDAGSNATLLVQKAKAHEALGEPDSVRSTYRSILMDYRYTKTAIEIITPFKQISNRLGRSISDEENLWIGMVHLNHRQYGPAKAIFLEMVKREIDQEVHPEVLFYLNRIHYLQKSYKTAQTGFKQLVESYPDHPKAALASFHIARCIRGRYGILTSLDAYVAFAETYPDDDNAADALLFVADQLFKRNRLGDAALIYHKVAHNYPEYKKRETAHWQEGYAYYRDRRYEKAADAYIALAKSDSTSAFAPRGLYWAGKAFHKKNLMDKARTLYRQVIDQYPSSYYAYKAMKHLNAKHTTRLTAWQRPIDFSYAPPAVDLIELNDSIISQHSEPEKRDEIHYTRAAALFQIGLLKEGETELEWYSSENSHNLEAQIEVVGLYYTHKHTRQGIRAASRLQRQLREMNRLNQVPWPFLYPAPFWDFIQEQAVKLNIDPLFILALMRQESRFDHNINSRAGAYGLMQLMPATALSLAKQQRIKNYSKSRLLEPNLNITLGTNYLVELLRRFKGRPELVLAGYNGGPNRVSRWMRQRGTSDIDEFVEEISLDETRLFVKLVMNNYAEYVTYYSNQSNKTQ